MKLDVGRTCGSLALAKPKSSRYALVVTANSVTGFRSPRKTRRTSAPTTTAGAFFVSVVCNGGCAWETERSAGFRVSRSANPRTAATLNRFAAVRGSSTQHGATQLKNLFPTRNPSKHAEAWKARALAALHSDSSLSVRLRRYNKAMAKARAIQAGGDA